MHLIDLIAWLHELNEVLLVIIFSDIFFCSSWLIRGTPLYYQMYFIARSKANFIIDYID